MVSSYSQDSDVWDRFYAKYRRIEEITPKKAKDSMPANGINGINGLHKLRFDTIEHSIDAFSMSTQSSSSLLSPKKKSRCGIPWRRLIRTVGNGEFIVVLDSTNRENEGDLIIAADAMTTEKMAFMVRHSRSVRLICRCRPLSETR